MSSTAARPRSAWNYFPHAMIGALGVVIAVNAGMIWQALATFPGVAAQDVFDHSNRYDEVLQQAQAEAALGWSLRVDGTAVTLAGRDGAALSGATVIAEARRPLGPDLTTRLAFAEDAPGRYVTTAPLPAAGQWELRLVVTRAAETLHATRRVTLR